MADTDSSGQAAPSESWRDAHEREHFVQFYEDEAVLLGAVHGFIGAGFQSGGGAVIIATRPHLDVLEQRWQEQGIDLAAARRRGGYTALDAAETLSRFVVNGWPHPARFTEVIEPVIASATARTSRLNVFGEMVALLWNDGRHDAALELERMWNELAARHAFALFCAYPIARNQVPAEAVRQVCLAHSRALPSESYAHLETPSERLAEICELQHKAHRLEHALGDLREEARRKDVFLAMLSHELRNPLAPIRNVANLLRRTEDSSALHAGLCETLDRQIHHMSRLLDDLLDVSRVTQDKIRFRTDAVDVQAVVARAIETCRPQFEERHHKLSAAVPERSLRVRGDATRLVQALGNLLSNAAKFTPDGGRIDVTVSAGPHAVQIGVKDDGIGMTAALLPRIFDMFVQGDQSLERTQGGLGIGLGLVRKIVEHHAGQVSAASAGPGRGSEFVITLPLLAAGDPETERRPAANGAKDAPHVARRVLVVDDNRDAADSMAALLRRERHTVAVAFDGPTALEQARVFAPDFVLLDIGLPGMNGYQVATLLRERACRARIVALTGYGRAEDADRAREAGFDEHLVKPVDPLVVLRLLQARRTAEAGL